MSTSWLRRYRKGEREKVWREMNRARLKGDAVLEAREVAAETMGRAAAALGELSQRLRRNGYVFRFPGAALEAPSKPSLRRLGDLEEKAGAIPLALQAFWEKVGTVNFIGSHPAWPLPAYWGLKGFPKPASTASKHLLYADPIVVGSVAANLSDYEESYLFNVEDGVIDPKKQPFRFTVGPDETHKANVSGDVQEVDAGLVADPKLLGLAHGTETFVAYLRRALKHAGFAGLVHHKDPKERRQLVAWAEAVAKDSEPI